LWKEKPGLRYEISDDMMATDVLIGKTKAEVVAFLGPYEWLSWDDHKKNHDNDKWNYSLGVEPGAFNTKKECIEIVFKHDKVAAINPFKDLIEFDEKE
jgi:hypothetical protein